MSSTVTEQEEDTKFTSKCPYCGEKFVAETQMEADNQEGVHRTDKHVQDGEIKRVIDGKTSEVDGWRRETENKAQDNSASKSGSEQGSKNGADELIKGMRASQDKDGEVA